MNNIAKAAFIRELGQSVIKYAIANVHKMPEEWDGHELRQYLADKFADSAGTSPMKKGLRRRKAYENEVLVRNL